MLSCRELTDLATDYVEGALSLGQRLRFRLHVGMCRHCRNYLRQLQMTIRMLGRLPQEVVPPECPEELLVRFRNWKR